MRKSSSSVHNNEGRSGRTGDSVPHGRDMEEVERRRREWRKQQQLMEEHERLKKQKIEEWERKRKAQEEGEAKNRKRRTSYQSDSTSRSRSPGMHWKKEEPQPSTSKSPVMSQKLESSSNNTRLFKGPEGTKIDMTRLHNIKVDIHRKITGVEISNELHREIDNPEDVKVKRREGEGAKPIFEREELKRPEQSASEVEEHRTVVALNNDRTERKSYSTRRRSRSPMNTLKQCDHHSRRESDSRSSRPESTRHNVGTTENHRNQRYDSDKYRSKEEHRERTKREDSRERRSQHRSSRDDVSRDRHRDRRDRSRSAERDSRRNGSRPRSSRDVVPHREQRDRSVDDSRVRRTRDNRSRERRVPPPHHYAEPIPVPVYYETFHPRPMMVGPIMPIPGQMPMGRGRMPPMMGPMRPPFPPRFMSHHEMFRPAPHPDGRYRRMY